MIDFVFAFFRLFVFCFVLFSCLVNSYLGPWRCEHVRKCSYTQSVFVYVVVFCFMLFLYKLGASILCPYFLFRCL